MMILKRILLHILIVYSPLILGIIFVIVGDVHVDTEFSKIAENNIIGKLGFVLLTIPAWAWPIMFYTCMREICPKLYNFVMGFNNKKDKKINKNISWKDHNVESLIILNRKGKAGDLVVRYNGECRLPPRRLTEGECINTAFIIDNRSTDLAIGEISQSFKRKKERRGLYRQNVALYQDEIKDINRNKKDVYNKLINNL